MGTEHLGVLPGHPEHERAWALGVSADGRVIVGASFINSDPVPHGQHAFVWDEVHGMRELEQVLRDDYGLSDLHPWGLSVATAISDDRRTIVGTAKPGRTNGVPEETWVVYLDEPIGPPLPEDGDYNANGLVEQADLDLVLLNWGEDAGAIGYPWINDLPAGRIDQHELDAVLLNWGARGAVDGATVAVAVPEPAAWSIMLVCGLAAVTMLRRSLHRNIARDPRDAVEVGIVAGEIDEAVVLHDGDNQGVVAR